MPRSGGPRPFSIYLGPAVRRKWLWSMVLVAVLAAAGCGGSGSDQGPNAAATVVTSDTRSRLADASTVAIRRISRHPTATPPMIARVMPTEAATPTASDALVVSSRLKGAEIGAIDWTTSIDPTTKSPGPPLSIIPSETRVIYATLPIERANAGTTIEARWTYNNTALQGFRSAITFERPASQLWIEFHIELTGDSTWPAGLYGIEVTVDAQPARQSTVTVE